MLTGTSSDAQLCLVLSEQISLLKKKKKGICHVLSKLNVFVNSVSVFNFFFILRQVSSRKNGKKILFI